MPRLTPLNLRGVAMLLAMPFLLALSPRWASAGPDADSLLRRALQRLDQGSPDQRRIAIDELEEATRLASRRTDLLQVLAHVYAQLGHLERARGCYDRVTRLMPDDADAQHQLGVLWKWEWLSSLDSTSYGKAVRAVVRAAQLDPARLEPRLELAGLALAKNNSELAGIAARSAFACDREAPEAALALACAAWRVRDLAFADSVFRAAVPRLPREFRRRFSDLPAVAWSANARTAAEPDEADAFWSGLDPDLTTRENEARLEFWSRVALALLLYRDARAFHWDVRAELVARYGVPPRVELQPPLPMDADVFSDRSFTYWRYAVNLYAPDPVSYPYHRQIWLFPELGLRIPLWDRSLREEYTLPTRRYGDSDLTPNPGVIASNPGLVAVGGGLGVFHVMPPGTRPLAARGQVARLPSERGAQLLAHLDAPGDETETLTGTWVVVDAKGAEVARTTGALAISACQPGGRRVAQFHADVPPGDYRVHLSVEDGHGGRGLVRLETRVEPPAAGLTAGDLVLLCGSAASFTDGDAILIEPNFEHRVRKERTLTAYFELDHLTLDETGRGRFSYRYTVRPLDPRLNAEARRERSVEAEREEENVGARRRQFVSAPIAKLPAGAYELEVLIRDLRSGGTATCAARFTKD